MGLFTERADRTSSGCQRGTRSRGVRANQTKRQHRHRYQGMYGTAYHHSLYAMMYTQFVNCGYKFT